MTAIIGFIPGAVKGCIPRFKPLFPSANANHIDSTLTVHKVKAPMKPQHSPQMADSGFHTDVLPGLGKVLRDDLDVVLFQK